MKKLSPQEERQEAIAFGLHRKSLDLYAGIFPLWVKAVKEEARKSKTKEQFLASLKPSILKGEAFSSLIQKVSYLGNLIGQAELRREVEEMDPKFKSDAEPPLPSYLDLSFSEAIEYFKAKVIVPNVDYAKMKEGYHSWAFSVAGETRKDILQDIKELLEIALEDGDSLEDFEKQLEVLLEGRGWGAKPGSKRSYIIFDTNIRGAIGSGRGQQMKALNDENPERNYVVAWRWRDSPIPRPHHQALHNKAIPFNHPFWKTCRCPGGFGCRCSAQLMRPSIANRLGIQVLKPQQVPNPKTIADPGFRYPLWGGGEEARKAYLGGGEG